METITNSNMEDFLCLNDAIFDRYCEVIALRGEDFPLKKELYGEEANKWGEPIKYWGKLGLAFETVVETDTLDFSPALGCSLEMDKPVEGIVILHWATEESKKRAIEYRLEEEEEEGLFRELEGVSLEEKLKFVRYEVG